MIPLGGGTFYVREDSHFVTRKGYRSSTARMFLSEIVGALRNEGYDVTQPKGSKRENVASQCSLGDDCGVELCLSPGESTNRDCEFIVGGFGYVGKNFDYIAGQSRVTDAWKRIMAVSE